MVATNVSCRTGIFAALELGTHNDLIIPSRHNLPTNSNERTSDQTKQFASVTNPPAMSRAQSPVTNPIWHKGKKPRTTFREGGMALGVKMLTCHFSCPVSRKFCQQQPEFLAYNFMKVATRLKSSTGACLLNLPFFQSVIFNGSPPL